MDAIPSPPETRARSRSKTPFTKGEENGKEGRKSPNLQAITEDPEVSRAATPATKSSSKRQKASQSASQSSSSTTVFQSSQSSTTTTSVSTRKSTGSAAASPTNGNDSAVVTPPTKKSISKEMKDIENKRMKEIKQSEVTEKITKKTVTSTPKMSPNSSANFKLNSSHEDLDLDQHPAYKEYLQAGEFWNKYPKTDYTYSEVSKDRREIGQGYVSMPNMSRRSMDRHVERVHQMMANNPEQESYLRQRYQINPPTVSRINKSFKLFSRNLLNYDSGDEVDLTQFDRRTTTTYRYRQESVVRRTFVRVWTWFTSIFTVFTTRRRTSVTREQFQAQYGTPRVSLWSRVKIVSEKSGRWVKEAIFGFFKKVYLALATILYLDTLLVRQRRASEAVTGTEKGAGDASTTAAEEEALVEEMPRNKRRFLWILLILLPILLLAGWYWFCPQTVSLLSSVATIPSSISAFLVRPSALLVEKYQRGVEVMQSLEMPPIGGYVNEAGSRAGEKIVLLGASALNALSWFKLPSFNWTWSAGGVGGDSDWTINNYFSNIVGGGGSKETVHERVIERVVREVPDWSKVDLSGLRDELKRELKGYVDSLMAERKKEAVDENRSRSLSAEEIENILNLLLEKLRAGDYFKLDLTEDNLRSIFLDMRQRFLQDNEVFMSQLITSIQGSLDLSSWDEKLRELKRQILGTTEELSGLREDGERIRAEMVREDDLKALKETLMTYINEMIKLRVTEVVSVHLVNIKNTESLSGPDNKVDSTTVSTTNDDEVRRLIAGALKVYDADKTGLSDYALESAGGQVLSTRCTENYHTKSAQISVFGIPLWYPSNTPRTAIQPNVLPGNCWAFQGFPGFLVLQLNMDIFVTGFTMEHIPKSLSNGRIDSAPKGFSVWGLNGENDQEPIKFGQYEYSDADDASSYQHFEVQNEEIDRKYRIVELRIESNHGHANYTCLYRFRVHGTPI